MHVKHGAVVAQFEREFAAYVKARYCIALCNGTATLETALVAIGVGAGDVVAVPPLTMSATTIGVLRSGAVPKFYDVDPSTWIAAIPATERFAVVVGLFGAHPPSPPFAASWVHDAAQTLAPHDGAFAFTSYSFQSSKHLTAGEGGALVTNSEEYARRARWYSSLGYDLSPDSSRIDPARIKSSDYARHIPAWW